MPSHCLSKICYAVTTLFLVMIFLNSSLLCIAHQDGTRGGMTLSSFQSIIQTFVDDEMAFILDQSEYRFKLNHTESDEDTLLKEEIVRIDSEKNRRMKKDSNNMKAKSRGRFDNVDSSSLPSKIQSAWDEIISHGWTMAKVVSNYKSNSSLLGNMETLFLICHSSLESIDGNKRLKEILNATGKSIDTDSLYFEVIYSDPKMVCIISTVRVSFALIIASESNSSLSLVPWIDVMKISPEIFSLLLATEKEITGNDEELVSGLRNFRKSSYSTNEGIFQVEDDSEAFKSKYVAFSLISPSTKNDALSVIKDIAEMASIGRSNRFLRHKRSNNFAEESNNNAYNSKGNQAMEGDKISSSSIYQSFSITNIIKKAGNTSPLGASARYWSRMLSQGLESDHSCDSLIKGIVVEVTDINSHYEFQLVEGDDKTSSSNPACVVSLIAGLAVHPFVVNVDIISRNVALDNVKAQWVSQGKVVHSGLQERPWFDAGIDGTGQVVSISDSGLDVENCHFRDNQESSSIFDEWDYSRRKVVRYAVNPWGGDTIDTKKGHGTHVAGTIAGAHINDEITGNGDEAKEGIAPGAKIHFFDMGVDSSVFDPRDDWIHSFYDSQPDKGAKIASGSWGFGYISSYNSVCRRYDQILFDHPDVLFVASAGNKGNKYDTPENTIGAPSSCKNTLSVGATHSSGFGLGPSYIVDFSSRGPTADGRTKPDIMSPGYALNSASSGYNDCSEDEPPLYKVGTSMAAPVVSGTAALIRQYFVEGWYPCGEKGCGNSMYPSGSLMKAILANGAQFLKGVQKGGSKDVLSDQPIAPYDNNQNMGAANLIASLPLKNKNDFNIFVKNDAPLSTGEEYSISLQTNLEGCKSDLSATLTWYDPPGASGCNKCLVNDLDLVVKKVVTSELFFPNGDSKPDNTNNLERVRISNTEKGEQYEIKVKVASLGPSYSEQNYSLAVTGCFKYVSLPSGKYQLATTLKKDTKHSGIMFAIKAKVPSVKIESFSIYTPLKGAKIKVFVYKLNTTRGISGEESFLRKKSKWKMISPEDGIELDAMGGESPTIIPIGSFDPVPIVRGSIQSFYITFATAREMFMEDTTRQHPTGSLFKSDNNIDIMSGVGKHSLFGRTIQSRMMNGDVVYSINDDLGFWKV